MLDLEVPAQTRGLGGRFAAETPDRARLHAVLEGRAPGRVLADRADTPAWIVVRSAWYGRVFVTGDVDADVLRDVVATLRRDGPVHLDVDDPRARDFPPGATEVLPRLEFCRPLANGGALRRLLAHAQDGCEIRPIDAAAFSACRWRSSLLRVFASADRYLAESLGFALYADGALACEAHGFFWGGGLVEIGAIRAPECRGRRYAPYTVARLVDACERHGYTSYWGCDVSNAASASVAAQLGYGPPRPYAVAYHPAVPAAPTASGGGA